MEKKKPIGDFDFRICVFRMGDWIKMNMGKTLIQNSKSLIGNFITNW